MKTDSDLQRDVLAELTWEPSVQAQHIGVSVKNGVVTLTGDVPSYAEKFATENAAKRVAGVQAVAEELNVNLPSSLPLKMRLTRTVHWPLSGTSDSSEGWTAPGVMRFASACRCCARTSPCPHSTSVTPGPWAPMPSC